VQSFFQAIRVSLLETYTIPTITTSTRLHCYLLGHLGLVQCSAIAIVVGVCEAVISTICGVSSSKQSTILIQLP
jgi:hypothetical protein